MILAIDTSAKIASCSLGDKTEWKNTNMSHSEAVLPLVEAVLSQNNAKIADISAVAVVTGPGSFTGLRIGVAAAKGFCIAENLPIFGVSALACIALSAAKNGAEGYILAMRFARADEWYFAIFSQKNGVFARILSDSVAKMQEIETILAQYSDIFTAKESEIPLSPLALELANNHPELCTIGNCETINPTYLRETQAEQAKITTAIGGE